MAEFLDFNFIAYHIYAFPFLKDFRLFCQANSISQGGMLQKQGYSPRVPKSPIMRRDESNKFNFEKKNTEESVVLRVRCGGFIYLKLLYLLENLILIL